MVTIRSLLLLTGLEWDSPVDAFSVGCVLAELVSRRPLFTPGFDIAERIAAIEVVIGYIPTSVIKAARKCNKRLFTKDLPSRAKFPSEDLRDDDANLEAIARVASRSHF